MEKHELYHHGIKGMHWGIRRTKEQLGYRTSGAKNKVRSINDDANERIKQIKAQSRTKSRVEKAEERAAARIAKAEAKYLPKKKNDENNKSQSIKDLSDEELIYRINRIGLETKYRELTAPKNQKRESKGKKFVMDVLESSGKNVATQTATYVMGTFVNKALESAFGEKNAINPKKGQKDK